MGILAILRHSRAFRLESVVAFPRRALRLIGWFTAVSSGFGPAAGQDPTSVLPHYDLSSGAGIQVGLSWSLQEVSGLATSSDGRLFAHDDERAIVHELDPATGRTIKAFYVGILGIPGDFEGLAIAEERFFLVTSSGRLVEFREGGARETVAYQVRDLGLERRCEMEGLAYDAETSALLLPCKRPRQKELEDHLVVFSVPLQTLSVDDEPRVFLPLEVLDDNGLGDDFHPSAIEVHPTTRSILILAAREEAGAEVSPKGELLGTFEMKRRDHPQPEGVAFMPDGSLVLADEGRDRRGTITVYPRRAAEGGSSR
jgi:uncharacterized protein YjiK